MIYRASTDAGEVAKSIELGYGVKCKVRLGPCHWFFRSRADVASGFRPISVTLKMTTRCLGFSNRSGRTWGRSLHSSAMQVHPLLPSRFAASLGLRAHGLYDVQVFIRLYPLLRQRERTLMPCLGRTSGECSTPQAPG